MILGCLVMWGIGFSKSMLLYFIFMIELKWVFGYLCWVFGSRILINVEFGMRFGWVELRI